MHKIFWHGDNNGQCFGWSVACRLLVWVNVKRLDLCKSVGCCLVLGCRFGQRTSVGEPVLFPRGVCACVAVGPEIGVHRVLAQVLTR